MPNSAMDNSSKDSTDLQVQDAVKAEIEACMQQPGADPKSCAAKAYGMAREKTGKDLNYGK
jgi:hypothetical protein